MNITFLGATKTVTGSNFLLEVAGKRILIDCGLYQGKAAEERENYEEQSMVCKEIHFVRALDCCFYYCCSFQFASAYSW